jgi:hypothetical protein
MTSLTERVKHINDRELLHEDDIISYEYYLQNPIQAITTSSTSYVIQNNNSSSDIITDLYDSYILLNWQLIAPAGQTGTFLSSADVASLSPSAWAMLSNIRLEVSGVQVDYCLNPGQVHNILSKARLGLNKIQDQATETFWYPTGYYGALGAYGAVNAAGPTDSYWLVGSGRAVSASGVGGVGIWSKLMLRDVLGFTASKKLLPQCQMILRCDKAPSPSTCIMRTNAGDAQDLNFQINAFQWYTPGLKLKGEAAKKLSLSALSEHPIPIDWFQYYYQLINITAYTSAVQMNLALPLRGVRHLFLAVQPATAITAQLNADKSAYVDQAASMMYINYNGQIYPFQRYQPTADGYTNATDAIHRCFAKNRGNDSSLMINSSNFPTYNAIYYFDTSRIASIYSDNSTNQVLQIYYQNATQSAAYNFHCVMLAESHHHLKLVGSVVNVIAGPTSGEARDHMVVS